MEIGMKFFHNIILCSALIHANTTHCCPCGMSDKDPRPFFEQNETSPQAVHDQQNNDDSDNAETVSPEKEEEQ